MMANRLTINQRRNRALQDAIADRATPVILAEYQRLARLLRAKLRRLDRTRPKLKKQSFAGEDLWGLFAERLRARLLEELQSGGVLLWQLEEENLRRLMGDAVVLDPVSLTGIIENDLGQRIKDIENILRREVGRKVTAWYNTPGSTLEDIIGALSGDEGPFSRARAEAVARTEVTRLNSGVKAEMADQLGVTEWWWSTRNDQTVCQKKKRWMKGPDGLLVTGCRELHGKKFSVGQPMPPDASHPNCRCSPILIIPDAPTNIRPFGAPAIASLSPAGAVAEKD